MGGGVVKEGEKSRGDTTVSYYKDIAACPRVGEKKAEVARKDHTLPYIAGKKGRRKNWG